MSQIWTNMIKYDHISSNLTGRFFQIWPTHLYRTAQGSTSCTTHLATHFARTHTPLKRPQYITHHASVLRAYNKLNGCLCKCLSLNAKHLIGLIPCLIHPMPCCNVSSDNQLGFITG